MNRKTAWLGAVVLAFLALLAGQAASAEKEAAMTTNPAWKNGPPADASYFPIAVWLQDPKNAPRYKAAGINLFVGLWKGPTEEQLKALTDAGMPVICDQNEVALKHKDDPIIVAWMHGDEPDNAQALPSGKGYGPPIKPEKIVADYEEIRKKDSTRPVMLNLGQGVAWDNWHGRGVRSRHPEDYPEYIKGGDIVSFDIYPVAHDKPEVKGKLWYVAQGVERLVKWSEGKKIIWNCVECTRIGASTKATPEQVRSEVWMALIHGSKGLIYFVHEWKPKFCEWALLEDPPMLEAVTALNKQIKELAPVLNSATVEKGVTVESSNAEVPVATMVKKHGGATYLFAVAMREGETKATFALAGLPAQAKAEVLGENRSVDVKDGSFQDAFKAYGVHLYRLQ
jgi:hypothetical protein